MPVTITQREFEGSNGDRRIDQESGLHDPERPSDGSWQQSLDGDVGDEHLPERFQVTLEPHGETIVLAVHGEVDLDSVDEVERQFGDVLTAGFRRVVLDLRAASFVDSSGVHAVLRMGAASRDASLPFGIVRGPRPVHQIFEVTGTEEALHFIDPAAIDQPWT